MIIFNFLAWEGASRRGAAREGGGARGQDKAAAARETDQAIDGVAEGAEGLAAWQGWEGGWRVCRLQYDYISISAW